MTSWSVVWNTVLARLRAVWLQGRGARLGSKVSVGPGCRFWMASGIALGERATLEARAIDTLAAYAPALKGSIREVRSITPLDLEQQWGLTEGDLNHGQLILDQALFMRPMPGWSDHRTPVDGLHLGGSGVHGGGGISGAAGRNAARAVLRAKD